MSNQERSTVPPLLNSFMRTVLRSPLHGMAAAQSSVAKLKGCAIRTVYPGHGQPFAMTAFLSSQ